MSLTETLFGGGAKVEIQPAAGVPFVTITLDASVREIHRATAKVTRHPVEAEAGEPATVSDGVQAEPLSLQIEGVISNDPAEFGAAITYAGQDRASEAFGELLFKLTNGQLCDIVTTLNTYEDMVLEGVEVTRDKDKGHALYFSCTATQVSLVELKNEAEAVKPRAKSTTKRGAANAQPVTPEAPKQTLFQQVTGL